MTNESTPEGTGKPGQALELVDLHRQLQHLNQLMAESKREEAPPDEDVIDLREYWRVLVHRKATIFSVLAVALVAALLISFLLTPIYRATAVLQIERESSKVLEYDSLAPEEAAITKDFYATQYELLRSRNLARRVIDQVGLETSNTFAGKEQRSFLTGLRASVGRLFSGTDTGAEDDPEEPDLEKLFLEHLNIAPVKNSRLVHVHYESPSPDEAAVVANAITQNFINMTLERRYEASSYAKKFLEEQIKQVRANLEDSEKQLVAYARERGIVNLDNRLEILLQNLSEVNTELTKAESERMQAESDYQQMLERGQRNTSDVLESPLIQTLKESQSVLRAEYQEQLKIFTAEYPTVQEIKRQIEEIAQQIDEESSSIASSVKSRFFSYVDKEVKLNKWAGEIKDEILAMQDRSTDFQSLKREVETNRELYNGLLQRMKEVGVSAGITTNNISVVDAAEVPREKFKPSLTKNLAIAIALGLFSGVLLAFLFETLDDTLKTSEEVEKRTGSPVLGVVPRVDTAQLASSRVDLLAFKDPKSALAEAYRSIRTALFFATAEGAPKVLHFTSSGPGEGKTTSAVSTAIAFAQAKSKVLLIDGDLRNPSLHQAFSLQNTTGLTNYLTGNAKPIEITQETEIPDLYIATSGPIPPDPVELLSSAKMIDLIGLSSERFDFVIIDGPPVIGLADALVLAGLARGTIFVVDAGTTRIAALEGSIKRLRAGNAKLIGSLLVKLGRPGTGYGYSYDYHYTYSYGGGKADRKPALSKQEA